MTKEDHDIQRKLKVLRHAEKTGHVAKTCRYFGVGRSSFVSGACRPPCDWLLRRLDCAPLNGVVDA